MKTKIIAYILVTVFASVCLESCKKNDDVADDSQRSVMILYSAGYNDLYSALQTNISELSSGYLPTSAKGQDIVLVVHKPKEGSLSNQTAPEIIRMYKNGQDVVQEIVKTYNIGDRLADASTMRTILADIRNLYPAGSYGMVFSSHATGWLPSNYYGNSSYFESPATPLEGGTVRPSTIGQETYYEGSVSRSAEMELEDFAKALPMHFDYVLLDACFAGCVEVAFALRANADIIGFSPAEVLKEGFDYTTIAKRLLKEKSPVKVCEDYIARYERNTGVQKSAVVSVVDASKMGDLATVCKGLFEKYRTQLKTINYAAVQPFYGGSRHWFFDLEDALVKAGITTEERQSLESALSKCVIYKAHTGQYYSALDGVHEINTFCGLSSFIPSAGGAYLNNFYKTLSWNQTTQLVK